MRKNTTYGVYTLQEVFFYDKERKNKNYQVIT